MGKELDVLGSLNGDVGDLHRSVEFLRGFQDRFAWDDLFGATGGLGDASGALASMARQEQVKAVINPNRWETRARADSPPQARRRRARGFRAVPRLLAHLRPDGLRRLRRHGPARRRLRRRPLRRRRLRDARPPAGVTDVLFSAIVRAAGIARDDYLPSTKLRLEGYPEQSLRDQLAGALFRVGADHADVAVLGDVRRDHVDLRRRAEDLAAREKEGLLGRWGVNGRPRRSGRSASTRSPPAPRARSSPS
ncbi:hypothetical protein ACQEU6_10580 [Spirillospora sp. CA-108201]